MKIYFTAVPDGDGNNVIDLIALDPNDLPTFFYTGDQYYKYKHQELIYEADLEIGKPISLEDAKVYQEGKRFVESIKL